MVPPSLIHVTLVRIDGSTELRLLFRRLRTICSNSGQACGVLLLLQPATSTPAAARSVGTIYANPCRAMLKAFVVGLPKLDRVPLILILYHVAWMSRPLSNGRVGANSPPKLKLFPLSGPSLFWLVFTNCRKPASMGTVPAPRKDMPVGRALAPQAAGGMPAVSSAPFQPMPTDG